MRLTLACIGKLKTGPEKALADDYATRIRQLGRSVGLRDLRIVERSESQRQAVAERMAEEEAALLGAIGPSADLIVLDERGKNLSSVDFAKLIESRLASGSAELVLLIGGPDGHGQSVRDKARHIISLGGMTWPHRLVRVMILEQIYRAVTIMANHPYHRA